jgi:hypothetical protein
MAWLHSISWGVWALGSMLFCGLAAAIEFFLDDLKKRLKALFNTQLYRLWLKVAGLEYRDLVAGVEDRCAALFRRIFGDRILSARSFTRALVLSVICFCAFIAIKTILVWRHSVELDQAAGEAARFLRWLSWHPLTYWTLATNIVCDFIALAVTRRIIDELRQRPNIGRLLELTVLNLIVVAYLAALPIAVYYRRPEAYDLFDLLALPQTAFMFLWSDYRPWEIVAVYFPIVFGAASPLIFNLLFLLAAIAAKALHGPIRWFLDRLFAGLERLPDGVLKMAAAAIAAIVGLGKALAEAFP